MLRKSFFLFNCALLTVTLQASAVEEISAEIVPIETAVAEIVTPAPEVAVQPKATPPTEKKVALTPKGPFDPFTGAVVGAKVRMRTQPTLESHVVRETSPGEMFAVMGETNEYYAVSAPKGMKGYVFRTFILDGAVEGERVNVRLYPDIEAPIVAQLNRGEKISYSVSDVNPKWLTINLPDNARFFIAKEYIEKKGNLSLIATVEKKRAEAAHHLQAAALFAHAEVHKPFEQVDLDKINEKFDLISKNYKDVPAVADQIKEAQRLFQDIYIEKKVAFLEGKTENRLFNQTHSDKLAKLGVDLKSSPSTEKAVSEVASAASEVVGLTSPQDEITEKMMAWQPLEESLYHLWAAANSEKTIEEFYAEEKDNATVLSGTVEPYTRPVKNRPGDFLLKSDNLPIAFLYSTQINLENVVGKKVSVVAAPRPNHNFAFPAYFVIHVE